MPVFTYHAGRFGTLFIEAKMIIIIHEVANTTEAHIHECELSNGKDPWVVTPFNECSSVCRTPDTSEHLTRCRLDTSEHLTGWP